MAGAGETTILLPYDKAELFASKLELSNQPMVTWQAYITQPSESLPQIAARFGLSLETLRTVNGIGARSTVPVGHALLVPTQAPSDATAASLQNAVFTAVPSGRLLYHKVRKGETLTSIATHYAVTAQDIRSWNTGVGPSLAAGQRLRVISDLPAPGSKSKAKRSKAVRSAPCLRHQRRRRSGRGPTPARRVRATSEATPAERPRPDVAGGAPKSRP